VFLKKKRNNIDDEIKALEEMIDQMIQSFFGEEDEDFLRKPAVIGFSLKINENGEPYFEKFGTIQKKNGKIDRSIREPLSNVIETNNSFIVTFELPGISQEDISILVKDGFLLINAKNKDFNFSKKIFLGKIKEIKQKSFNNGILELVALKG